MLATLGAVCTATKRKSSICCPLRRCQVSAQQLRRKEETLQGTKAEVSTSTGQMATNNRMPAEWEPHDRTWMGWPQRTDVWRDNAEPSRRAFVQVATAISNFEPVTVCANADQVDNARSMLPASVQVMHIPQDDSWFRDTAPVFVHEEEPANTQRLVGINFVFNSWGRKNRTWELDNQIASRILQSQQIPAINSDFVLEGGSIHVDGEGTLLTTKQCLLNPNRNPSHTQSEIEEHLKHMLGVSKVVWLDQGLYADEDTDGHVDNFACFVAPARVLLAWTDDVSDPQFSRSKSALDILSAETDAKGRKFEVIKMPLPPPQHFTEEESEGIMRVAGAMERDAGTRLAASYVNFYLPNGGVVAPAFGIPESDDRAKQVLQQVFPDRKVMMIPLGREILLGGGNVHCITAQQPAS